jgi:hypothetical protein
VIEENGRRKDLVPTLHSGIEDDDDEKVWSTARQAIHLLFVRYWR